jgi:ABC-type glycerol-3-phosphate transport system substrate-binding protein
MPDSHLFRFFNRRAVLKRSFFGRMVVLVAVVVAAFAGCEPKETQRLTIDQTPDAPAVTRRYPCRVLLVGNPSLAQPLRRQWAARHDSEFELETVTVESFSESDFKIDPGTDVVVYPTELLIELIYRDRIVELHKSVYQSDDFNRRDLLTHFRKSAIRYDSKTWAVPCGSPLFALVYQPQSLPATGAALPRTWPQLIRWGKRLKESSTDPDAGEVANGKVWENRIGLPLAEGWAAKTFLAIAACYARQKGRLSVMFQRRTMEPLIDSDAFVRALEELKALADQNRDSLELTPAAVMQQLIEGKLAAGITWPTAASRAKSSATSPAVGMLLVGDLPGSDRYFDVSGQVWSARQSDEPSVVNFHGLGGVLASQSKQCRRPQSAFEFLKWLSEMSISQVLFAQSTQLGPFRETHLGDSQAWLGEQLSTEFQTAYIQHLKSAHQNALIMTTPNILKNQQYLEILDREIRQYLQTDRSAKQTLQSVSTQWNQLTESIGRKVQSNLLRRNSNF